MTNLSTRFQKNTLLIAISCFAFTIGMIAMQLKYGLTPIQIWVASSYFFSILVFVGTLGSAWQRSGILTSIFLLGTTSQLSITQPLWYQYLVLTPSSKLDLIAYAFIAIQSLVATLITVPFLIRSHSYKYIDRIGSIKVVLFLLVMAGISFSVMLHIANNNLISFAKQFTANNFMLVINMLTLIAIAHYLPTKELARVSRFFSERISFSNSDTDPLLWDRRFLRALAFLVLAVTSILCALVFERLPHVEDEVVYLVQANQISNGTFAIHNISQNISAAFEYFLLHYDGEKLYSIMPFGWPAILSIGAKLNLAWIVNPLLAAASIFLCHALTTRLTNRATANIVALLMASSPWFLATSATLMAHTFTLVLIASSWLLLHKALSSNSKMLFAFLSGGIMGWLFLTRYLDGLIIGSVTGIWLLLHSRSNCPWKSISGYALGCLIVGALVFPYSTYITGDPLTTPLNLYMDLIWGEGANRLGFGSDIGPTLDWGKLDLYPGHSLSEAIINLHQSIVTLSIEQSGWIIGSLIFGMVHLIWGKWTRADLFMVAIISIFTGIYCLYWFNATYYIGPRYWFSAFFPFIFLSARGIQTSASLFKNQLSEQHPDTDIRLGVIIGLLCIIAVVIFLPWRSVTKYHDARGYHTDYRQLVREHDLEGSLIFINSNSDSDFGSAIILNAWDYSDSHPLFVKDLGEEYNSTVAKAFPGRPIYYMQGRTKQDDRVVIIQGPIVRDETEEAMSEK